MTIYISGPMTGYPEFNYPAFQNAAQQLREIGYTVISPHELEPAEKTWEAFMRVDIKALMDCHTRRTYRSQSSKGSRHESSRV